MKACKITFSLPLLLKQLGLDNTDKLSAYSATVDRNGNVVIFLTGDHPDLPDVKIGDNVPDATIKCKRIESRILIL